MMTSPDDRNSQKRHERLTFNRRNMPVVAHVTWKHLRGEKGRSVVTKYTTHEEACTRKGGYHLETRDYYQTYLKF